MKELEPVQGRETKMNTGKGKKIWPVRKDRMDLGCLPCRAAVDMGGDTKIYHQMFWDSEQTLLCPWTGLDLWVSLSI